VEKGRGIGETIPEREKGKEEQRKEEQRKEERKRFGGSSK
jgi:hypothetical protein